MLGGMIAWGSFHCTKTACLLFPLFPLNSLLTGRQPSRTDRIYLVLITRNDTNLSSPLEKTGHFFPCRRCKWPLIIYFYFVVSLNYASLIFGASFFFLLSPHDLLYVYFKFCFMNNPFLQQAHQNYAQFLKFSAGQQN